MAARRLVIVMLVLLGISTLAAALAPAPDGDRGDGASEERAERDPSTQPGDSQGQSGQEPVGVPGQGQQDETPARSGDPGTAPADPPGDEASTETPASAGLVYARVDFSDGRPQTVRVAP